MEKFNYEQEKQDQCIYYSFKIGSHNCLKCKQLIGFDSEEKWIKCKLYQLIKENNLIDESIGYLENQSKVLNFLLKNNKIIFQDRN